MIFATLLLLAPVAIHASPLANAATACLSSASVPQIQSTDSSWSRTIKPFNLRLPYTPIAVAYPTTVPQVQAAVLCGAQLNLTVTPKSGGHSYASHGLGGEDGHLVIDMRQFKEVTVDKTTQIATVGVGARLGNVAQSLYSQGQRAFSHGTCPGVGVGGHVVGGGYGYSSRTKGLASDALVEAEIVLANGTFTTASATNNPELFWALRGAGSSFGVITRMKFQTFAAPTNNIVFSYGLNVNAQSMKNAFAVLQDYANSTAMPAEMNMRVFINRGSVSLMGVFYGTQSAFQTAISPVLSKIGNPGGQVQQKGWIDALTGYAYMSLSTPLDYDVHETFFSKSLMTERLDDTAMTAFWNYWYNTARANSRDWYLIVDLHGGQSSAITKLGQDYSSYAHRKALIKYEFYDRVNSGSYPSNGLSFLNGWVDTITNSMKSTQFGMYINYADPTLSTTQAQNSYWLGNYAKLANIKKEVDPANLFSNPQAVGRVQV
ncbi:hypothetical protein BJ875DRAFT_415626 [Amylocarpus encephaloides]|uniref:FAD-binding PCMH-type domain-containing protein n=1 Tax=Amylocarpus encephaloides TaxID=45428 RepID=A0A9P7YRQ4_9HELO|nr:hypothetical protein BJ875DRAFT_415626 [Amylocarpus encephaloides]